MIVLFKCSLGRRSDNFPLVVLNSIIITSLIFGNRKHIVRTSRFQMIYRVLFARAEKLMLHSRHTLAAHIPKTHNFFKTQLPATLLPDEFNQIILCSEVRSLLFGIRATRFVFLYPQLVEQFNGIAADPTCFLCICFRQVQIKLGSSSGLAGIVCACSLIVFMRVILSRIISRITRGA